MVWENVVGAFSSNKGGDFRAVLEETIRIAEPDAPDVPLPAKGKWPLADCWYGDGWSVAYRVLDAQFWGVPQRRRRIALVADFGGHAAPEILFVRESVCGDTAPGRPAREETAAGAGSGAGQASAYRIGAYYSAGMLSNNPKAGIIPVEKSNTLDCNGGAPTSQQGGVCIVQPIICAGFQHKAGSRTRGIGYEAERSPTLTSEQLAAVYDARGSGDGKSEPIPFDTTQITSPKNWSRPNNGDPCHPLAAGAHPPAIVMATGQAGAEITQDASPTMNCNHEQPIVAHALRGSGRDPQREDAATYPVTGGRVRRLTPLECERLQGYPDGWTVLQEVGDMTDSEYEFWKSVLFEKEKREGRVRLSEAGVWEIWKYIKVKDEEDGGHWENTYKPYKPKEKSKMIKWYNKSFCKDSDSARYMALGNSIALPPWKWVLKRLCACYERDATMASLFDGIGGFPLIWERMNGPGSCLWASEIEEFPIAVTRARFDGKSRW
jgi:Site-specific DNA methylase